MSSEFEYSNMDNMFKDASKLIKLLELNEQPDMVSADRLQLKRSLLGQHSELLHITKGISLLLQMVIAMQSSMGECRMQTPYSKLRPVINSEGQLTWCCNHDPEHCA